MILGKGFLGRPLIGLASGWELYTVIKAVVVVIIIIVFEIICISFGPVILT